jgi:hypothetical protein
MTRLVVTLTALLALASCYEFNPDACKNPKYQDDPACHMSQSCSKNGDCTIPGQQVCNMNTGMCVGCLDSTQCGDRTPVCSAANACVGCKVHTDCVSEACMPDGSCAADVAYVQAGATGTTCTISAPCGSVMEAVATNRPVIKMRAAGGTIHVTGETQIGNRSITILADRGATLQRDDAGGPILSITGDSHITIVDLRLTNTLGGQNAITYDGASNTAFLALLHTSIDSNTGLGLSASGQPGSHVTIDRSVFAKNAFGGARILTDFTITNTIVVQNGTVAASALGGLDLNPNGGTVKLEFTTIANNTANSTTQRGVQCDKPMTVRNNIVVDNISTGGQCTFEYSMFDITAPANPGNFVAADPKFSNTVTITDPGYYRLTMMSPAKDKADPGATDNMFDIDAIPRPQGNGRDLGASEFKQ